MSYHADMRRAIRPAQTGRKATIMSKTISAFISYNAAAGADPEADIVVLVHDRHSRRDMLRLIGRVEGNHFHEHVQFDGDADAARAAAVAHAAERRAQLARLYA
jgi:hypothetical protein